MSFKRADRVSDLIKAEISNILLRQVRDPRVRNVTITDVKMSDDLRQAKIFFVPMGSDAVTDDLQEGFSRVTGFLKRELGKRVQLRYVPNLRFIFDKSFGYGDRIERLLGEIEKKKDHMISRIVEIINSGHRFLIASHVRPDGDAIGSILAMYHVLSDMGKEVVVYNRDKTPENYRFLPASEVIVHAIDSVDAFDAAILLDCSELERVGDEVEKIGAIGNIINIDHHISNDGFSPLSLVDAKASSTGEIIFGLIEMLDVHVTEDIATNIYTAILTDTGAFCYSNTTSDTLKLAARLVEAGADPRMIAENVFETRPLIQIRLMEKALNTLEIDWNGRIGSIVVTQEMLAELGAMPEHTEGLVDLVRSLQGVDVAVFYLEMSKSIFKASLRSKKNMDVEKVARQFDGGGHVNASACRISGDIKSVKERLVAAILRIASD